MEAISKRIKAIPPGVKRFVHEQNVARFRKLLNSIADEVQHRAIAELLANHLAKLPKNKDL
jgi:hypothetical protein